MMGQNNEDFWLTSHLSISVNDGHCAQVEHVGIVIIVLVRVLKQLCKKRQVNFLLLRKNSHIITRLKIAPIGDSTRRTCHWT